MSALSAASLVIIYMPVAQAKAQNILTGSRVVYCAECQHAVWIPPTSNAMQACTSGSVVACSPCALAEAERVRHVEMLPVSPAQRAEIAARFGRN